ncbi:mitogen-activated protein kinase kinase kinase 20-like [Silene latifolia]|uniref:mitogen-activated protein kinase kinase kinase 20-like n=1 Tax=Silene latifolia TaxID=37657 RepID=UPI003D78723C
MEWVRGEVIGQGSFGRVNLASVTKPNHVSSDTDTAVVVKSSHILNSSSLKNEKQVLVELGKCGRNIIQYLGDSISEENGSQYYNIFLEYASKGSLWDHLRKSEVKFGISEVKRFTRGILKGLCDVHESGFVHCDVKLQNVLVFEDEEVKIADFGLSRRVEDCKGNYGGQLRGTPLYMSPEMVAGTAGDVWAVGCAVVEMLTGKPAWECSPGSDVSCLLYRIGVCGECPRIPEGVCDEGRDFISKCFLKDPKERWTVRMLLDHPFVSGYDDVVQLEKRFMSPRCPFEFPQWESTENLSIGSGSIEYSFLQELDIMCWSSVSSRFESELSSSNLVPTWDDSNEWISIR